MARRKRRRRGGGIKVGGACATGPMKRRFGRVGVRCYCKTKTGAYKFLPKKACSRRS